MAGHHHGNDFEYEELQLIELDFLTDPVVAVHCKAGKGRTGLIICCFLLYTEMFDTVEEAIEHYDTTRTKNKKALTISSQIRQVYHFKHFLDRTCIENAHQGGAPRSGKKNYILNSLKNFKFVKAELDMMENCEEYQYKNSLNMFSLTLGPFERPPKKALTTPINKGGSTAANSTAMPAKKGADGQNEDEEQENSEEA